MAGSISAASTSRARSAITAGGAIAQRLAAERPGRRLDHMWASPDLAEQATGPPRASRMTRDWEKPSRPRAAHHGVRPLSAARPPPPARRAAQAVDALRHGWPLAIGGGPVLLPVETALASEARVGAAADLRRARRDAQARQPARGGRPARPGADPRGRAVRPRRGARRSPIPRSTSPHPLKGPFRAEPLRLAGGGRKRRWNWRGSPGSCPPSWSIRQPRAKRRSRSSSTISPPGATRPALAIATRARLPVSASEDAEIVAFRSRRRHARTRRAGHRRADRPNARRWCGCIPNA